MSATQPGLGRRFAPDNRDHPLRAAVAETRPDQTRIWPMFSRHLNQGPYGTCVGHYWRHQLTGTPRPYRNPLPTAVEVYDAACLLDPWPENNHARDGRQFGTAIRAGGQALRAAGLIEAYGFAPTFAAVRTHLSHVGAGGFGTIWPPSMSAGPDPKTGFVRVDRSQRSDNGHAYLAYKIDMRRGAIGCLNSWDTWGPFWLTMEDAEWLFDRDGEFCAPQERARTEAI